MKKIVLIAVFGVAMALTSCVKDDVEDLITDTTCQTEALSSKLGVDAAITAYEAAETTATCNTLKSAIESYRAFDCIANDVYATEYDALPADCSNLQI